LALVVVVGLGGALGCSKKATLNPVQGKVLYKNEPLSGALVTFHPKGNTDLKVVPPTAATKEDGTFTVNTGDKEGAVEGEYIVTIICSREPPGAKKAFSTSGVETQDILKGAYQNRDSSKITVKIERGANQLKPFDLK
jgi:hypothetical protein